MAHLSVLYSQSLHALNIKATGLYLDGTFGRGGHSQGILNQLNAQGKLLAFDKDLDAIHSPQAQKMATDERFELQHNSFSQLATAVKMKGWDKQVDGILLDLGLSSPQLDTPERGFSFSKAGHLDMRMNTKTGLTAAQWLAVVTEAKLRQVLFEYGEERFARRIAKKIVEYRQENALISTAQLAHIITEAMPVKEKHKHPATRSFQAIRIAVNQELDELKQVLQQATAVLKPQGRLVVISFHSLEDRIVKRFIRSQSTRPYHSRKLPILERDFPQPVLKKIGHIIRAETTELQENPRSRSAIMRVAEKI